MRDLLQKKLFIFVGIILCLIVLLSWNFHKQNQTNNALPTPTSIEHSPFVEEQEVEQEEDEKKRLTVDVKGAVRIPGVYELEEGNRVLQAVEKAGGFTEEADQSRINLAELIYDSMMIVIPKQGEVEAGIVPSMKDTKIRINYADLNELEQLPGIGPSKAQAIMDYRTQFGPFQKEEDLLKVKGIGEKTLEQLREYIRIP
ncbi:helix-hairpin-helix domain-containing protein [Bacillaceae bacterium S4-13-58]